MNGLSMILDDDFDISEKQRVLIQSLFAGLSEPQAKKRAGYGEHASVKAMLREFPDMKRYALHLQQEEKKKWAVSREQVTQGIMEAIEDAKHLEEPNTQINGWRELGRLHGLYAPEEKKITLSNEKQEQLRQLEESSTEDLLDMAGAQVIEGDFETVEPPTPDADT